MLLSIGRLADLLGVSVVTIRSWERSGKIKQNKLSEHLGIIVDSILPIARLNMLIL